MPTFYIFKYSCQWQIQLGGGWGLGMSPLLSIQFLSFSFSFWRQFCQIISWRTPFWDWRPCINEIKVADFGWELSVSLCEQDYNFSFAHYSVSGSATAHQKKMFYRTDDNWTRSLVFHFLCRLCVECLDPILIIYGVLTLPDTNTDLPLPTLVPTPTQWVWNPIASVLVSVWTPPHNYLYPIFIGVSVSVGVGVGQCEHTIKHLISHQ